MAKMKFILVSNKLYTVISHLPLPKGRQGEKSNLILGFR